MRPYDPNQKFTPVASYNNSPVRNSLYDKQRRIDELENAVTKNTHKFSKMVPLDPRAGQMN